MPWVLVSVRAVAACLRHPLGFRPRPQPQPAEVIAAAMGATVSASAAVIAEMTTQIAALERQLAADVLGEFGDAPDRYADAKSRRNYGGTSPITRASGTRRVVLARHARNKRLADAIYLWAFSAISASPGARAFYDHRRAGGDTHHQALRALGNRLVGILPGCLASHTPYSETTAWVHRTSKPAARAA